MISTLLLVAALAATPDTNLADVPQGFREHNWGVEGSCAHASTVTAFRYNNQPALAEWWRKTYSGGETLYGTMEKMTAANIAFVYTDAGDVAFLEWAVRNRQVVVLYHVPFGHALNLVDLDADFATLIDNNHPDAFDIISRNSLINQWHHPDAGGWALVVPAIPPPPYPDQSWQQTRKGL